MLNASKLKGYFYFFPSHRAKYSSLLREHTYVKQRLCEGEAIALTVLQPWWMKLTPFVHASPTYQLPSFKLSTI